jgi:hypothetical protein
MTERTKDDLKKRRHDSIEDLIQVEAVKRGMHELAEGITCQTVYRISRNRHSRRLFGLWPIAGMSGSGKFVKVLPEKVTMPTEALQYYRKATDSQPDEIAVFLSTRLADSNIEAILAAQYSEHWLQLYRWRASWRELGLSRLEIYDF